MRYLLVVLVLMLALAPPLMQEQPAQYASTAGITWE